jgi:four helix bundle protein
MEYIYEKLEAWQDAVDFANQVIALLRGASRDWKNRDLIERAEESSANIAVAISRAKCSRTRDDIIQQLYLSRRSLYETMTLLEIFRKNRWISDNQYQYVKEESTHISVSLVNMMRGMNIGPTIKPVDSPPR